MSLSEFELKLQDAIDAARHLEPRERSVLSSIADIMKGSRRTRGVVAHQRSIIVLQTTRHRRIVEA